MATVSFIVTTMLLAATGVNAGGLDDFSNNLATDLGPLVALFGENITRQYISESTSFLDYFIFSMAPMGIVTAITSVIRVCGDSSLRAFIGRAQEGDGAIEAELCTSTSRDVCELFHKGGITRVFGKPKILEIIRTCGAGGKERDLYLFREHLKELPEDGEWMAESDKPPLLTRAMRWLLSAHTPPDSPAPQAVSPPESNPDIEGQVGPNQHSRPDPLTPVPMVQNPNLSLNVGIEKLPNWAFVGVATIGLFLQTGVVAMAGILTWWLEWSKDGPPDSLVGIQAAFSSNKSPLAFMIGTGLLCTGMFWCAALVGEITDERSYRRRERNGEPRSRSQLFWLQPGGQEVNGETFDAFAYFEEEKRKIDGYTTSTKNKAEKFHVYTWVAVLVTVGGYVAQFIGLRGMNASLSIAQLGITLFMSFLRGCLRMRRLDQNDNKLTNMPDMVAGHELDWLTFKLADEERKEDLKPHDGHECLWIVTSQPVGTKSPNDTQERPLGETLLRFRMRLAQLTGHNSTIPQKNQESVQNWSDKQVAVRLAARRVARALSDAADEILGRSPAQQHRVLKTENLVLCSNLSACEGGGPIYVNLDPPSETASGGWTVSSESLEGILGLWLWSLKKAVHFQEDDEHCNKRSTAENLPIARIFPSFGDDGQVESLEFVQGELDLWLGPGVAKLQSGTLQWDSDATVYDSLTAWREVGAGNWRPGDWKARGANSVANKQWKRYFGLQPEANQATNDESPAASGKRQATRSILYTSTEDGLLSVCSRVLYSILLASLAGLAPECAFGEVVIMQTSDVPRLEHHKVEAIVTSFTRHELGSRSDAILSIIPGIKDLLRPPKTDDLFSSLMRLAHRSSNDMNGNVVETILQWVYRHSFRKTEGPESQLIARNNLCSGLMALGEIYRSALESTSSDTRKQGYGRLQQLIANYGGDGEHGYAVGEILDRYRDIAVQIASDHNEMEHVKGLTGTPWLASDVPSDTELVSLIKNGQRTKSLYLLCKITSAKLTADFEGALASAAERKWPEVAMALMTLSAALVDGQDNNGRTALSHWAEHGVKSMVSALLDRDAFPDLPDMKKRTPLWWAARRSERDIIELLRNTGRVNLDSVDRDGRSPFSQAAEHGNREVVRMLRDTGLVALDRRDHSGRTPLSHAAGKGALPIVEELINDSRRVDPDAQDSDGRTPLSWAVGNGKAKVVAGLLKKPAARADVADTEKRTPLFWAVQSRQPEVLSELLANLGPGAKEKVNVRDLYGQTALLWAARHGYNDMIRELRRLLDSDFDVDAVDDMRRTATWWALRNGHVDTAQVIDGNEAALPLRAAKTDSTGRSPLWWASHDGNESLVEQLLGLNVDADTADSAGHTPLLWAARNGHAAIVRRLLESGRAQTDMPDAMGRTALSWAARFGHDVIVSMLLRTGSVHPDSRDDDGRTPLSWAATGGHVKSVEALVECGASVDAKDFGGMAPWDWARESGHEVVMGCLAPPEREH